MQKTIFVTRINVVFNLLQCYYKTLASIAVIFSTIHNTDCGKKRLPSTMTDTLMIEKTVFLCLIRYLKTKPPKQ